MYTVLLVTLAAVSVPLALRFNRYRVRVVNVRRVRSEISDLVLGDPCSGYPMSPVSGNPSPRNEPLAGPEQPDDALVPEPPTGDNLSRTASPRQAMQAGCVVRPRTRVVLSDPSSLSATLSPGWRIK